MGYNHVVKYFLRGTISVLVAIHLTAVAKATATFGDDIAFLRKHTTVIVLGNEASAAQLALAPVWQARVMTSTAQGNSGWSFGWINRELIESGKILPHINAFGGEDRLWLGPEGGQFSIFFPKGAPFDYEHWLVPASLDTQPFRVVSYSSNRAQFKANITLTNYSGAEFKVALEREVRLLDTTTSREELGLPASSRINIVGYQSTNVLANVGSASWKKETGLLSIWILGMFTPAETATIIVPIKPGPESELGPVVTSDYFGAIPPNRLKVTPTALFLKGDGRFRSKIGVSPRRSLGVLGSYDAEHHVLTIVQFNQPRNITDYVNSQWKLQADPYRGDVINAYNDGPPTPGGRPIGPFFEMESSSPAAALLPAARIKHIRRTFHLTGTEHDLDIVSRKVLGMPLVQLTAALQSGEQRHE